MTIPRNLPLIVAAVGRASRWGTVLLAALATTSCGEGPLDALDRESEDPIVVAPSVRSFAEELVISVSWPEDPRADEYLLEAASGSAASPSYSVAYRGTGASFPDSGLEDQSLRLYRLVKLRGERAFGPSEPVLGVCSATCRDSWEPNDSADTATDLGYAKTANLYYYRSWGGLELRDVDWYSVKVPPRMKAYIVVEQVRPHLSYRETTGLVFAMKGRSPEPISNGTLIELPNYSYAEQAMVFRISPQAAYFIGADGPQGGSLVDYTVQVERFDASI